MSAVPTGLGMNSGFANPTLKRGANNRCAYGAGNGPLPAWSALHRPFGGTTNRKASAVPEDTHFCIHHYTLRLHHSTIRGIHRQQTASQERQGGWMA